MQRREFYNKDTHDDYCTIVLLACTLYVWKIVGLFGNSTDTLTKSEQRSDLFLLVEAGHDDIHLLSYHTVRNDAAAEFTGMLDLYTYRQTRLVHCVITTKNMIKHFTLPASLITPHNKHPSQPLVDPRGPCPLLFPRWSALHPKFVNILDTNVYESNAIATTAVQYGKVIDQTGYCMLERHVIYV